jgi:tRNA A37 N6-isopentenylltransferase MiaA
VLRGRRIRRRQSDHDSAGAATGLPRRRPGHRHKIVRALEIIALTERRVSDFPKPNLPQDQNYDFRCWFVYYPRERLYTRIEMRCEAMIQQKLIDEVKKRLKMGGMVVRMN